MDDAAGNCVGAHRSKGALAVRAAQWAGADRADRCC
jgi:hypothetical protein